ncbi:Histidine phosphatase-like protein 7 [Elsinoe fawcettii]|nr:Histidine phosphatase-like protein 7 [Elsinoe fawcettii]
MGKPRMIILVRHAQSEGNLNRDVHQIIPDHRVKLTDEGWKQAHEAGHRLRELLRPDDTIQVYTSPYRRTRETTEGLLSSLTASTTESGPSPFSRNAIKVYEDPRLREQGFGNFQPCSAEMERMWQERADYGHFWYKIPDGESAADAYDRCAGFNESLWRSFSEDDFPSVCILVTHGLMARVFLMKWYHFSVEYFEDLRNINHCEFIVMKRQESGKYGLENKLRTWSELKRRTTVTNKDRRQSSSTPATSSPSVPRRIWGGCVNGCNHDHSLYPRRMQILNQNAPSDPSSAISPKTTSNHATTLASALTASTTSDQPNEPETDNKSDHNSTSYHRSLDPSPSTSATNLRPGPTPLSRSTKPPNIALPIRPSTNDLLRGRDGGGSLSGLPTPLADISSDDHEGYTAPRPTSDTSSSPTGTKPAPQRSMAETLSGATEGRNAGKRRPTRQTTTEDVEGWMKESGMGMGRRADALGDPEEDESSDDDAGVDGGLKRVEEEQKREEGVRESVY